MKPLTFCSVPLHSWARGDPPDLSCVQKDATRAGDSGRGDLAGWNNGGTSVDSPVNVASADPLDFRDAAGAGRATRLDLDRLKVISTASFSATLEAENSTPQTLCSEC